MPRQKLVIILFLCFSIFSKAQALQIEYGTVLSTNENSILVQYNFIGKKENYICILSNFICEKTKKYSITNNKNFKVRKSLQKELKDKKAQHITYAPSNNMVAYYLPKRDEGSVSTFAIKNIKTGNEYTLVEDRSYWDLVTNSSRVYDFSPDSKYLGYLDDIDGYMSIYYVDIGKLSQNKINSIKLQTSAYTVADFIFYDSQTIYYVGNTKENPYNWSLYQFNVKTGKEKVIESGVSYVDRLRKVGSHIILNHIQSLGYGPEAYNTVTKKLKSFRISSINTVVKNTNEEVIKIGNMSGVLMPPIKNNLEKSYPIVIWLHGGPVRQASLNYNPYHSYGIYDSILKLLQKNSVIVLKLDYRGSIGFGRSYSESIKGSVGKGDVEDVMNAVSYLKNRYHVKDLYLVGNSYGGYMSLKSLVEHPEIFTGVMSINGVTDWESLVVKMQNSIFNAEFDGLPDLSNRALYDQASIINKINNIGSQKIEIIAGMADRTIPYWQATDMYEKMKSLGKNVTLISYKGEDHVYKEKKTIVDLCNQLFNFVGVPVDIECNQ